MPNQRSFDTASIKLKSNFLTVKGYELRANVLTDSYHNRLSVSADELGQILMLGRQAIAAGTERGWSIFTAYLGDTQQTDLPSMQVFTIRGHRNGGIIRARKEIQPRFHDFWDSIALAGFAPEVRRTTGNQDDGAWLLLRQPKVD